MATLKTSPNNGNVEAFLQAVGNKQKREESFVLLKLMQDLTGEKPTMWGDSIVGFGSYHYRYKSGREGDWFLTGFSPRKQNFSVHIMSGFEQYDALMSRLGKFKTGVSCLYIKKLADIDMEVLKELITLSVAYMRKAYPTER